MKCIPRTRRCRTATCRKLTDDKRCNSNDTVVNAIQALNTVISQPEKKLLAFQVGHKTDVDFYTWLESHPVESGAFHRFMEAQFQRLPSWLEFYNFKEESGKDLSPTDVAFVDVAGGNGQQCEAFKKMCPDLPGRVILQDRPEVLQKALPVEGMETQPYDYFTEQPVKSEFTPSLAVVACFAEMP